MSDSVPKTIAAVLKPFADFADVSRKFPRDLVITSGSRLARRQLTMGDCYDAADILNREARRDLPSLCNALKYFEEGDTFWIAAILLAVLEQETGFKGTPRDRRDYDHG